MTYVKKTATLKSYRIFHQAWADNPRGDWLLAARYGYKSPRATQQKAVENTRMMLEVIKGLEAVAKPKAQS